MAEPGVLVGLSPPTFKPKQIKNGNVIKLEKEKKKQPKETKNKTNLLKH